MRSATIKFEEGGKEKVYVISEDDGNIKVSLFIDWKRDDEVTIEGKDITQVVSTYSNHLTQERIDHEITQRVHFD